MKLARTDISNQQLKKYPAFTTMDDDQLHRISNILNNDKVRSKKGIDFNQMQLENEVLLPKRKIKEMEKMTAVLDLYFNKKLRPREIAKQRRVPVDFVYNTLTIFKKKVKDSQKEKEVSQLIKTRKFMSSNDPLLIDIIKKYLETFGIYKTKLRLLKQHIKS